MRAFMQVFIDRYGHYLFAWLLVAGLLIIFASFIVDAVFTPRVIFSVAVCATAWIWMRSFLLLTGSTEEQSL